LGDPVSNLAGKVEVFGNLGVLKLILRLLGIMFPGLIIFTYNFDLLFHPPKKKPFPRLVTGLSCHISGLFVSMPFHTLSF